MQKRKRRTSTIGWKKVWMDGKGEVLLRLRIQGRVVRPNELVFIGNGRGWNGINVPKFRTSAALVLSVHKLNGTKIKNDNVRRLYSSHDLSFTYHVGKVAKPDWFDPSKTRSCSHGIHFFKHRRHAVGYAI